MSSSRILVVTTVAVPDDVLRELVRAHGGDGEPELRVVAPAADVSPLEWLTNDEDAARREAAGVAAQAAGSVAAEGQVESTEVGDMDPVQAIEDALREFPADEVIVVTTEGDDARWLEKDAAGEAKKRFGLPVTHVPYSPS